MSAPVPAQVRIYPNGPILVRGDFELVGADGQVVGQRRRVVALCRCGHSGLGALCDGTHKLVRRFNPDPPSSAPRPSSPAGGEC